MANIFTGYPHCIVLYRFESGALGIDSKGGNDLDVTGVAAETTDYKEGAGCGDFEASESDHLFILDADLDAGFPLKNGDATKKISMCFWFKAESLPANEESIYLFSKYRYDWPTDPATRHTWQVRLFSTADKTRLRVDLGIGNGSIGLPVTILADDLTAVQILAGRWYHLGIAYDDAHPETVVTRLWDDSDSVLYTNNDGDGWEGENVYISDLPIAIGGLCSYPWPTWSKHFDGLIDEMVIFNDVLTTSEIDQIRSGTFGAGSGGGANMMLGFNF